MRLANRLFNTLILTVAFFALTGLVILGVGVVGMSFATGPMVSINTAVLIFLLAVFVTIAWKISRYH